MLHSLDHIIPSVPTSLDSSNAQDILEKNDESNPTLLSKATPADDTHHFPLEHQGQIKRLRDTQSLLSSSDASAQGGLPVRRRTKRHWVDIQLPLKLLPHQITTSTVDCGITRKKIINRLSQTWFLPLLFGPTPWYLFATV